LPHNNCRFAYIEYHRLAAEEEAGQDGGGYDAQEMGTGGNNSMDVEFDNNGGGGRGGGWNDNDFDDDYGDYEDDDYSLGGGNNNNSNKFSAAGSPTNTGQINKGGVSNNFGSGGNVRNGRR
jgi:hypothetical protein